MRSYNDENIRMKRLLCYVMLLGGATSAFAQGPDPTPTVQEILLTDVLPVRHGDVAMGDFDQDSDLDMLLTGARGGPSNPNPSTVLYRVHGDTTLLVEIDNMTVEVDAVHMAMIQTAGFPNLWKSSASWGDFDSDGDLDLALMGVDARGIVVTGVYRLASANGVFTPQFRAQDPVHSGDLIWGDVDNDTDLDLLVCGTQETGEPLTTLYKNQLSEGSSGFQPATSGLVSVGQCSLDLGDYDIDGDLDVLIAGTDEEGSTLTRVYQNNGFGQFNRLPQTFESLLFSAASWGDYDADGYLDILESGARLSPLIMEGGIELYRYDTMTTAFTHVTERIEGAFEGDPAKGRYFGAVTWGDLDNDGFHDFVVTGAESPRSNNATQIYLSQDGQYLVKSQTDKFDGGFRGRALIVDYDLDRDLDVVVFGENPGLPEEGTRIRILRNNLIFGKRVPTPPDAIASSVRRNNVTLAWSPGLDRQTLISGLTYNIRVGSSPGAADIVSPMASLTTGTRHISGRGNVGTNLAWTLRNLDPGIYYWAVQALDHTYSGSVFSDEDTFTIE